MHEMSLPIWNTFSKKFLNDGMYEDDPYIGIVWPGYIQNKLYPFAHSGVGGLPHNVNWCGTDSPELFEKNRKKMPSTWRYHTKVVEYRYNSGGYRTEEWNKIDWKNAIVLFGDSCTFGIGQAEDETITHFLKKYTERPVVNLGVPGGSNDVMLNLSSDLIENFGNPYAVVMNWSTSDRFRFYHESGFHNCGPWDSAEVRDKAQPETVFGLANITKLWENMFINKTNQLCQNYYIARNAKALWLGKSKYISISYFPDTATYARAEKHFIIDNDARDVMHPGPSSANAVAKYITKRLKQI